MISSNDRQAWLEARKRLLTASDAAALLSISPYKTLAQLRMEKLGLADEWTGDESSDLALALEWPILEIANRKFGWNCVHNTELIVDRECPRLAATPDAMMESPWGLTCVQVKVTRSAAQEDCAPTTKSGKPSTAAYLNGAPIHYQIQVVAEMACTGARHGVLLALHLTPLKLRAYYVPFHPMLVARIRRETRRFWNEIDQATGKVAI